ncbi:HNH endonuclease [Propionimicrobium sp. PCR01-08-3]|uniref:HNH endonuclease n=1 Tax=Propionimicrobium sp. PCR01-08-3 TaxID=3052086 RepID=UPI0033404978
MSTSRTGTAAYKRWRTAVLRRDRLAGVSRCPICGVEMDYDVGLKPNSAEPDHILAAVFGGRNEIENGRAICRQCNQRRGNGLNDRKPKTTKVVTNLVAW